MTWGWRWRWIIFIGDLPIVLREEIYSDVHSDNQLRHAAILQNKGSKSSIKESSAFDYILWYFSLKAFMGSLVPRAHGSAMIPRKVGTHVGQKAGDQELAGPLTGCVASGKPFNICSSTLWFHHASVSDTDLIYLSKFKSPVPATTAAQAGIRPHGLTVVKNYTYRSHRKQR